jgi:hypothetical protein
MPILLLRIDAGVDDRGVIFQSLNPQSEHLDLLIDILAILGNR